MRAISKSWSQRLKDNIPDHTLFLSATSCLLFGSSLARIASQKNDACLHILLSRVRSYSNYSKNQRTEFHKPILKSMNHLLSISKWSCQVHQKRKGHRPELCFLSPWTKDPTWGRCDFWRRLQQRLANQICRSHLLVTFHFSPSLRPLSLSCHWHEGLHHVYWQWRAYHAGVLFFLM